MPTNRSCGSNLHNSRARGESSSGGVDQYVATPSAVAPSSTVWIAAATEYRFSRSIVGRTGDGEDVGRAAVLRPRLGALDVVAELALLHVVGERVAEVQAGVAGERGDPIREGVLVVRRPARQLAQAIDHVGRHGAPLVDAHVRAA